MAISLNDKYEPINRFKAIVEHGHGLLVVSAGPGTGKTYSLLRKIEKLIELGIDPKQIYYLTFVNSIVDAFKSDICKPKEEGGLGVDADELGIHISTLHSLAFKIVTAYSDELGLPSHLEIIDLSPKPQSKLSQAFVNDLFEYSKNIDLVSKKKDFDVLLKQLAADWRQYRQPVEDRKELEKIVLKICRRYFVCSWDQLVLLAIKAITENGQPKWLKSTQHFLIDEYQDFNPAEQHLLKIITEPSDSVIIVGDPDQSIYSGRSASPQGIMDLLSLVDTKYVNFVYCRRCPKKIIEAANNMLRYMDAAGFSEKELQPFKDDDGDLAISSFISCKAEVGHIAEFLKTLDLSDYSNTIILLPAKKAIDYYVTELSRLGINCRARVTDLSNEICMALLRLVIIQNQPFLYRILLSCFPSLERKYIKYVLMEYIDGEGSFVESLSLAADEQHWQKRYNDLLSEFTDTCAKLTSMDNDLVVQTLKEMSCEQNEKVVARLLASGEDTSAKDRVETALLSEELKSEESEENSTSIEVMTMHSSKGLSKELVIIPAFDEKLLPGESIGERLAEMHRLVYVAVTRSEKQIIITFPKRRSRGDPLNYGAKPALSRYAAILDK